MNKLVESLAVINLIPLIYSQIHVTISSPMAKLLYTLIQQCRSKGNISGGARERRTCEVLGGCGGMLPQKILKSRGLEMLFPAFSKSYM